MDRCSRDEIFGNVQADNDNQCTPFEEVEMQRAIRGEDDNGGRVIYTLGLALIAMAILAAATAFLVDSLLKYVQAL